EPATEFAGGRIARGLAARLSVARGWVGLALLSPLGQRHLPMCGRFVVRLSPPDRPDVRRAGAPAPLRPGPPVQHRPDAAGAGGPAARPRGGRSALDFLWKDSGTTFSTLTPCAPCELPL